MQVQSISAGKSEPSKITICPAAKNSIPEKMEKRRPPIDENKVEMPPVFPPIEYDGIVSRPLEYSASRRCPSSLLTATYDCTPHSRLVGRLDLQNISAACTACLFQQAVRMPVRPPTAGSASRPYRPPQSSSRNQQPQTNNHKPTTTFNTRISKSRRGACGGSRRWRA